MPCYSDYIGIDSTTTSRSGLYAVDLPGVELALLESLNTSDQADYEALWAVLYKRAWNNLINGITSELNRKFFVNTKLLSKETSEFDDSLNSGSSLAGIRIDFTLPKYAAIHVVSIEVLSSTDYDSPDFEIEFYDTDSSGELLYTKSENVSEGRTTINIDQSFYVDKLFIGYDPSQYSIRKTDNKYFASPYIEFDKLYCMFPCLFGNGSIRQINGGGLNVKYNVICSIEKFVCENINLFGQALFYRIGYEIVLERILGHRINCYTTMTAERAESLSKFYAEEYEGTLSNSIKGVNIDEDPFCFNCKNTVTTKNLIP